MDAVSIIETLNDKLSSLNSNTHFVLHRSMKLNSFSKAYTECTYTVWYINKEEKYKIIDIKYADRTVTEEEEKRLTEHMEKEVLSFIYNLLLDQYTFNLMINGRYKGTDRNQ